MAEMELVNNSMINGVFGLAFNTLSENTPKQSENKRLVKRIGSTSKTPN